uniref:Eukaryotic translation initiation factor 4C n=1 Tax=Denticeps clupeoides TaxID=299321 RepID=A0AAY4ANH6_9TELE
MAPGGFLHVVYPDCCLSSRLCWFVFRPQGREVRTGGVERTRTSRRRGSWSSKRTDRVGSPRLLVLACGLLLCLQPHDGHRRSVLSRRAEYAQVIKMLGNGRLEAMCFDGVKRLCHIRGKLRKKVWINTSDIILVGLRDYQDNKADVILKYNADEARSLKAYGELPEHAKINETDTFGPGDDDEIQFDDIGDDDEDIDDVSAVCVCVCHSLMKCGMFY